MIFNFREIRHDGKVIEGGMALPALLARGWPPDKIVRLEWEANGHAIRRECPHGVLAMVLPDGLSIALIEHSQLEGGMRKNTLVINADGSTRYVLADSYLVNGQVLTGKFAWFEPARAMLQHCFGAVFQAGPVADGSLRQCQIDFDTATGVIVGIYENRW